MASADEAKGDAPRGPVSDTGSPEVDIHALRSKVTHAVRTAITDVVGRGGVTPPDTEVDLDFSMPAASEQTTAAAPAQAPPMTLASTRAIGDIRPGAIEAVSIWRHQLPAERSDGWPAGRHPVLKIAAAFGAGVMVAAGIGWQLGAPATDRAAIETPAAPSIAPPVDGVISTTMSSPSSEPEAVATADEANAAVSGATSTNAASPAASTEMAAPKSNASAQAAAKSASLAPSGLTAATGELIVALPPTSEVLRRAEELLQAGDATQARQILLDHATTEPSAEVALALAKSYDVNVLAARQLTGVEPDAAEAEAWYRRWYELAVRDGMAADPRRLERLVRSLR